MQINNISYNQPAMNNIKPVNFQGKNLTGEQLCHAAKPLFEPLLKDSKYNRLQINNIKYIDIPIKSIDEYNEIFARVRSAKKPDGNFMWLDKERLAYYPKANEVEQGLLPYCGERDCSFYINNFLSERLTPEKYELWKNNLPENKDSFTDVVRVLDFSLKNLDEEFGKYKGIVFRQGFMGENTGQFISTSKNPNIAAQLNYNYYTFKPDMGFSVIRTNNGHKICDFQKKMNTVFSTSEEEILLPRTQIYREVSEKELDEELNTARNLFAGKLIWGADKVINGEIKEINGYNRNKLLNLVKVFDEI